MNIGVNGRTFTSSEPGGSVQAAKQVTKRLLADPNFKIILFGHKSIRSEFTNAEIDSRYYFTSNREFGVIWERAVLPHLAKSHDIDVLFAPNGNGPLTRQPFSIVMWIHDVGSKKGWMSPGHRLYRNTTVPRAAVIADRIVTPSTFSKKEIVEELGVQDQKVDVIYNGINEFYRSDSDSTPFDLPEQYILFVSSALKFGNRKNLKSVLKVYEHLKKEYEIPHNLVLVGSNEGDIYEKVPFDEKEIIITGYVSEGELKYAYENASVFLFPSMHEGFGLPPLEAMACSTPVVASSAASLPEVVGDAGLLVNPENTVEFADSILRVLHDNKCRDELIANGRDQIQEYTWEKTKSRLTDSFSRAFDDSRSQNARSDK